MVTTGDKVVILPTKDGFKVFENTKATADYPDLTLDPMASLPPITRYEPGGTNLLKRLGDFMTYSEKTAYFTNFYDLTSNEGKFLQQKYSLTPFGRTYWQEITFGAGESYSKAYLQFTIARSSTGWDYTPRRFQITINTDNGDVFSFSVNVSNTLAIANVDTINTRCGVSGTTLVWAEIIAATAFRGIAVQVTGERLFYDLSNMECYVPISYPPAEYPGSLKGYTSPGGEVIGNPLVSGPPHAVSGGVKIRPASLLYNGYYASYVVFVNPSTGLAYPWGAWSAHWQYYVYSKIDFYWYIPNSRVQP